MVLEHYMVKKELTEAEIAESIPDLWQPLTQQQRELLAQNFTIQKYKKNETIYCEGETPENLMCLLSGKVKIYKDGVGGRSQIIRVIKDKEYFAYRAYFAKENFVTAAAAFEPCTMCLIPMPVIVQLIMENTELAMFFIKQLSKDLGISDERTVNLTQKHIRGRLAESLLPVHAEHLPLQRRPGQPFQHDHFQCHPNPVQLCRRETDYHRRTENQAH